jgi:hypothetical protein
MVGLREALAVLVLVAGGLPLMGCSSKDITAPVAANLVPTDYRKDIIEIVTRLVDDPTNIRDAGITEPKLEPMPGGDARYMICVRFNPRNANHDYIGMVERVGYFYGGKLNQLVKAEQGQCKAAAYGPFPELEKICFGKSCR